MDNIVLDQATLTLFNGLYRPIDGKNFRNQASKTIELMKSGIFVGNDVQLTDELFDTLIRLYGIGGVKLNSTFHKSWKIVKESRMEDLVLQQLFHYFTTYGYRAIFGEENEYVYIPDEALDLPEIESIPMKSILKMNSEELFNKVEKLINSGVALSQVTLDALKNIVAATEDLFRDVSCKNREFKTFLCNHFDIYPDNPEDWLRFVVFKLTDETLIIKNKNLITKLKASNPQILSNAIKKSPDNLASIFFRYKPLFLAMKSVAFKEDKKFFNDLRRKANTQHVPLATDYLNDITHQIKDGTLNFKNFKVALTKYPVFRLIRLAYALNNRLTIGENIVYKIRNGKSYVDKTDWTSGDNIVRVLHTTLQEIANRISKNVSGKTVYIPKGINYALPATEKQFFGNIPCNSYVDVKNEDIIFGVHWYNNSNVVDLDFSMVSMEKFGWDARYRNSEASILFSGDVTTAPKPNGATELFYVSKNQSDGQWLMYLNHFNYGWNSEKVDTQFIVGSEKVSNFGRNYMINPNNILTSANIEITEQQNILGMYVKKGDNHRIFFNNSSNGKGASVQTGKYSEQIRDFMTRTSTNPILLDYVLDMAGAIVQDEIPAEGEYLDFSLESVDKTSILEIFAE